MFALTRKNPAIDNRIDQIFRDVLHTFDQEYPTSTAAWFPPCDIVENAENILVSVELPGIQKEEVGIEVNNQLLTIRGARTEEKEVTEGTVHRRERVYGSFERSFTLPSTVDVETIKAAFTDGVLNVTLPKRETAKPRRIQIG